MNAIPIFEAKNKLPFFIHQAEESGPVFISRRDKSVAVIISIDDFNRLSARRKPTILEKAEAFRKRVAGTLPDAEIDKIFSSARDDSVDTYGSHVFDGVFD